MADLTQTIPSEQQSTVATGEVQDTTPKSDSADSFFGDDGYAGNEALNVEKGETTGEEPKNEVPKEEEWYIPGRYKTRDDAIKNQDKAMGDFARSQAELNKKIEQFITAQTSALSQNNQQQEINPDTGRPYTPAEIQSAWIDRFNSDPMGTIQLLNKQTADLTKKELSKTLKEELKRELAAEFTWDDFYRNNQEMLSPENDKALASVLQTFPYLASRSDGLMKAKKIALSPGSNPEEKFENYVIAERIKKPANPSPVPPQLPGQAGLGGSPSPKDKKDSFWSVMGR